MGNGITDNSLSLDDLISGTSDDNSKQVSDELAVAGFVKDQNASIQNILKSLSKKSFDEKSHEHALKVIGQQLGIKLDVDLKPHFFIVNGREIICDLVRFEGKEQIIAETEPFEFNGRDQEHQTKEELGDILPTMVLNRQNTFPAISGFIEGSTKAQVFDGTRRRDGCILEDLTFVTYIAREIITKEEATQIADISRLRKELSYWERGKHIKSVLARNESSEEPIDLSSNEKIGQYFNDSKSTIQRCIKAVELPNEVMELIPNSRKLTGGQYKEVVAIVTKANAKESLDLFVHKCKRLIIGDDGVVSEVIDPIDIDFTGQSLMKLNDNSGLSHYDLSKLPLEERQTLIIKLLGEVKFEMFDKVKKRSSAPRKIAKNTTIERKGMTPKSELVIKIGGLYAKGVPESKVKEVEERLTDLLKELL